MINTDFITIIWIIHPTPGHEGLYLSLCRVVHTPLHIKADEITIENTTCESDNNTGKWGGGQGTHNIKYCRQI